MALIRRLKRITRGRIEAFLSSLEKPELILPLLLEELAESVALAAKAETKALTAVKAAQRRLDEAVGKSTRMQSGAELAVNRGDMELARKALAAQIQAEDQARQATEELDRTSAAYEQARAVRQQMQQQHHELKHRRRVLAGRAKTGQAANDRLGKQLKDLGGKGDRLLDVVAQMEEKVLDQQDEIEARSEVLQQLGPDIDDEAIRKLARDEEVQRRLEELRGQLSDRPPDDPPRGT